MFQDVSVWTEYESLHEAALAGDGREHHNGDVIVIHVYFIGSPQTF